MTSLMTSLTTSLLIRYEPQVFQTAQALLSRYRVPALQLELTRTPSQKEQTCAAIKMLEHLHALGYDFRQVPNALVDAPAPAGAWRAAPSAWDSMPAFPMAGPRARHAGSLSPTCTTSRNTAPPSSAASTTLAGPRRRRRGLRLTAHKFVAKMLPSHASPGHTLNTRYWTWMGVNWRGRVKRFVPSLH